MNTNYKWKFFRAGGFDQVKLETGADIANLDQLDQKLWVALACPTRGLEFDSRTLDLIDADKDGRVRALEVIAAAKWTTSLLKDPNNLLKSQPSLPLDVINDAMPEGKQILSSARQILANLGKTDSTTIDLEDTADTAKIFAATRFNGDGIIPVDAAEDQFIGSVITDVMETMGCEMDRSGKPGISQKSADTFFKEAGAYSNWWKQAEGDKTILPLGEATANAFAAVKAVRTKVEDYFVRCRLAAFDPRAAAPLNREEKEYAAMAVKELATDAAEIVSFPIAQIAAGKPLPLAEGVNPAWSGALAKLQSAAVKPLLVDKNLLTEGEWKLLNDRLAAFEAWSGSKVGVTVEKLGLQRVREILNSPAQEKINALLLKDKALEPEANAIAAVEKLIRFNRDLYSLCVNFVNFKNFYGRMTPAMFQAGRLYLDQRSCDLCLTVEDASRHAVMAGLAGAYLAYCDCIRKTTGEKLSIVAIFSQGDDDNLMVGRNGIFYDRKGRDYDATITKIVSNPISLRQAFWSPYKKLVRMIEEQINKHAAKAEADVSANLSNTSAPATTVTPAVPAAKKTAFDPSVIALISVALGSLAAAATGVAAILGKMPFWKIPLSIIGIMLVVSLPSVVLAFMKLRKRNLGPILDANGWAVNAKTKMNVPFGASLTDMAKLPAGSTVDVSDRYAAKSSFLPKLAVVAVILACIWSFLNDDQGRLYTWTNGQYGNLPSKEVLEQRAAAKKEKEDKDKADAAKLSGSTNAVGTTVSIVVSNAPVVPAK